MESRVKVLGHALHPMLIAFPLGLLATAVLFDIVFLVSDAPQWTQAAFYMIGVGVVTGLMAAVPGWLDWFAIPGKTRAKRIGLLHGAGNVIVLALFALSWVLRREQPAAPPTEAIVSSLLGAALALGTAWLGGELVERMGVGVADGAHLNAPSSLSAGGYAGAERRRFAQPAYAGEERRGRR
jgi:uncharacterized membrane protein